LRILFDKNVPVGVRRFLLKQYIQTASFSLQPMTQASKVNAAIPGSYDFIEMPLPPKAKG
jgi:hypothetical protein